MKVFKKEPNTRTIVAILVCLNVNQSINQSINLIRYQTNTGFLDGTTGVGAGSPKQCLSN
jgi:hypothetical protein